MDVVEEVQLTIRNEVRTAYNNDPIVNCDNNVKIDGTVEMWLRTSLTRDEMDRIEKQYPIVEIYGFGPDHFATQPPTAKEQIGLIVSVDE